VVKSRLLFSLIRPVFGSTEKKVGVESSPIRKNVMVLNGAWIVKTMHNKTQANLVILNSMGTPTEKKRDNKV
jgi:hypothetical protein